MVGWVLVAMVVILVGVLVAFNRWSRGVEEDLRGTGWRDTPIFGFTRRRVERRSEELSGPGPRN